MARAVLIGWFAATLLGCSDGVAPPVLGDPTGPTMVIPANDAGSNTGCSSPAQGCPCNNPGDQIYCGTVYRISGTHVDCSKGYLTCQPDGGWSACEGATIFMGD